MDQSIIARFRAGDPDAFDVVFAHYHPLLCAFVDHLFLGNADDAKDVVQTVFIRVWRAPERLPAHVPLGACLYEIARGEALNALRRTRRRAASLARTSADPAPVAEPAAHARLRLVDVAHAVAQLPRRCREAFVLRRIQGMSYAEIARRLGLSPRTVEHYVESGHDRILRILESTD